MAFRPGGSRPFVLLLALSSAAAALAACGTSGSAGTPAADSGSIPDLDATTFDAHAEGSAPESGAHDAAVEADATQPLAESGVDATTDASALETGATDASPDAGDAEAGAKDTGAPEAGVADTGAEAAVEAGTPPLGDVLTQHNDTARTGATIHETTLTVANVRQATFGRLFSRAVDDQIYAQPLVRLQVPVADAGVHDVLYVATMNDTVYAFDADSLSASAPLWQTSLDDPANGIVPVAHTDVGSACAPFSNISGNIGIESTPVIDPVAGRMYVVAKMKNASGTQSYTLHALDIGTGRDAVPPVVIQPSVAGTGAGSDAGVITFDASVENQRASLLLANGKVYIGFGGYCESGNYHGWLVAYDATTLAQSAVFVATPNGSGSGIWMSGGGPSADASGNVYVLASGGTMDVNAGGADFSEALLALTPSLTVADWFTPYDYATLTSSGNFYGSAGVLLVPGTTLAISGSETSKLYVNDTTSLGHWNASGDTQIVQSFQLGGTEIHGGAVTLGGMVYVWAAGDTLRRYQVSGGMLTLAQAGPSPLSSGLPGGVLSLSANGAVPGTAVLWVSQPRTGDASQTTVPGILQAYDASNVATELWDSLEVAGDDCGAFAKFAPPTIANGKVYLPSFANQVCVYGKK
jgi:hypothetical protein